MTQNDNSPLHRNIEKKERKKILIDLLITTMTIVTGICWGFFISACMIVLVLPYDSNVKIFVFAAFVGMALIGPGVDPMANMTMRKLSEKKQCTP